MNRDEQISRIKREIQQYKLDMGSDSAPLHIDWLLTQLETEIAKGKRLRDAMIEKTKRSNYQWSEGGDYLPWDLICEGEIKCALKLLAYDSEGDG